MNDFIAQQVDIKFTSPIEVAETVEGIKNLTGTLLRLDVPTGNGRMYSFEEADKIANEAVGVPLYYGIKIIDKKLYHDVSPTTKVGEVIKAWVDRASKSIKGVIKLMKSESFPTLVEEVKQGWGLSVAGSLDGIQLVKHAGRFVFKCIGFAINQLQLLSPNTPRGDMGAMVEEVFPVQETLTFSDSMMSKINTLSNVETLINVYGDNITEVNVSYE